MLFSNENPTPDPHEISLKAVDPSNPTLDEHKPISKFSIRDYVFSARRKDIKTNWPFSQKNLQLCLQHGVRDLLPPFKNLDYVQDQSGGRDSIKSSLIEREKIINSNGDPCNPCNDLVFSSPYNFGNIELTGSEGDKQLQFTKNNHSVGASPKSFEKTGSCLSQKPGTSKMKNCKLIVKVGTSRVEPNSCELAASSNCMSVVEPMTSKVCPVCKTFSSSSNTTLNAHIDQCLSTNSSVNRNTRLRVIKHRVKPRKTSLMVDIYARAPHCTLEELDQRNGRTLSDKPNLHSGETMVNSNDQEKKQRVIFEDEGNDGAVYIDANGTKLRILNRISDTSLVSTLEVNHPQLGKSRKGGKVRKLSSTKKKRHINAQKHRKLMKLAVQRGKSCSYKTRSASRVVENQGKGFAVEESHKRYKDTAQNMVQPVKAQEQLESHDSGPVTRWACSKRTRLLTRRSGRDYPCFRDSCTERSYHLLPPQSNKGMEDSFEAPIDDLCHKQPPLKKRTGVISLGLQRSSKMENCPESSTSVDRTFSSKVTKFSSLKGRVLSVNQPSSGQPKSSKKCLFQLKNVALDVEKKQAENLPRGVEDGTQVSLGRSSILKVRKRKMSVISQKNESTDLKPSSQLENCDTPSPRVSADSGNGFDDVGTQGGNAVIARYSGVDDEKVMSLTKSFDQDFYTMGNADMGSEMDSPDAQGNFFLGIDPITIPGPPGSYLPSPGRLSSSDDHQGNSSLTTSRDQSSEDHANMVDRYASNSPKSTNSTISNSMMAVSDSQSTEKLYFDSHVSQSHEMKLGFSDEMKFNTRILENGVLVNYQDGQTCCCSWKEGVLVNHQESQLLRRRVMSSSPGSSEEKQPAFYPSGRANKGLNQLPQVNNVGTFWGSELKAEVLHTPESVAVPISTKVPIRAPAHGDFDSATPSCPNPVLRLMGKNLMVVNNYENLPGKVGPFVSNENPHPKCQTGYSDHIIHQVTPFYGYNRVDSDTQDQKPSFGPPDDLNRFRNSDFSPSRCQTQRVKATSDIIKQRSEESITRQTKEFIVIDDSPENEDRSVPIGLNEIITSSGAIPGHVNQFYGYQGPEFSPHAGSHTIIPKNTSSSTMRHPSEGPMMWGCFLEGSNTLPPQSSLTSPSSTNCVRSPLQYSPSLS